MTSDALVTAAAPSVNLREEFWSGNGADWPRDGRGHIFASRIIRKVGKLMHRNAWTGHEPSTRVFPPLREFYDARITQDELAFGIDILRHMHEGYRARWGREIVRGGAPPIPTPDEWTFAVGVSKRISYESWSAYCRYESVVKFLVNLLEQGILRAALRPFHFGDPLVLQPDYWFSECFLSWFATCQVDIERPWSRQPVRTGGHWIYFDEDCFNAWYRSGTSGKDEPSSDGVMAAEAVKPGDTSEASSSVETPKAETCEPPKACDVNAASSAGQDPGTTEVETETNDAVVPQVIIQKPKKRRPGRKSAYPWTKGPFEEEVLRIRRSANSPNSVHAMADVIQVWCTENWGREPSASLLRKHVDAVLARNGLQFEE